MAAGVPMLVLPGPGVAVIAGGALLAKGGVSKIKKAASAHAEPSAAADISHGDNSGGPKRPPDPDPPRYVTIKG